MNNRSISLFLGIIFSATFTTSVSADAENPWWSKDNVHNLNVVRDLKQGTGRIWYVDGTKGDDVRGDGMSLKTPWKTISKAVKNLRAGDTLVIAAGLYRERLCITKDGTENNRILIGPQGNGEVIIDASQKVEGWTIYKENVYQAACPFKPRVIVVDEQPLFPEFSLNKLDTGKWYYNDETKVLYLSVPDGREPAAHDVGIIADKQYQDAILLNAADYVTLYGLTVRFAGGRGISILGDHNRVEKCNVKFNGGIGINMFRYGNTQTDNTMIVRNHIYHNFMRNWPRGRYKWGGWGGGAISHGTPNVYYIGNVVHKNGGEGLLAYGNSGTIFRDNIVYDNWSVNIYTADRSDCLIERNLIFCNEPNPRDLYNNRDKHPKDGKNLRRLRAEGIMTADEGKRGKFQNATIINNVIIGCRRGITHYGKARDSGLKNVLVANNTIIVPDAKGTQESYIGIKIPYNKGNNANAVYRNNIVFASHPDTYLLYLSTGPKNIIDPFRGLTFDHNIWYHSTNPESFHFGPTWHKSYDISFKVWKMKGKYSGQCAGSMFADPELGDVTKYSIDAASLAADSPAVNQGLPLKDVKTDYFGNPRDSRPDIGAVEFVEEIMAMSGE